MTIEQAKIAIGKMILWCCLVATLYGFALTATPLQAQSVTDGSTPLALQPGAPAGSYRLSDFEHINLFNGSLNFSLPLVEVLGRGDAGYTMTMPIERHWRVDASTINGGVLFIAYGGEWMTVVPSFSPGRMEARTATDTLSTPAQCPSGAPWIYKDGLTRLTFRKADGTEYEFRDQLTGGRPISRTADNCSSPGAISRGTIFVTADGSAATFISDTTIWDDSPSALADAVYPVSGDLYFRDGARYRIDSGNVTSIRDRNGNQTTISYTNDFRPWKAEDPLKRTVTVSYRPGGASYDEITYRGFGGASRKIRVNYAMLSTRLREDFPGLPSGPQLFPELNGATSDYEIVASIQILDGGGTLVQQYHFRYNTYGELARVELPNGNAPEYSGAAYEYDYAAGVRGGYASGVIFQDSGHFYPLIYRRLIQRRVYDSGGGKLRGGLLSVDDYSLPDSGTTTSVNMPPNAPVYETTVQVDHTKADGSLLAREKHIYFGSAVRSLMDTNGYTYPAYQQGKEKRTEFYAANGYELLRTEVTENWQQRAAVPWWTGDAVLAPPNDPRLIEKVTTLVDLNQVAKQTFAYDQYNNSTDVYDYDFAVGSAGALLRRKHIDYVTTNSVNSASYDTNTNIHLRSLPAREILYDSAGVVRSQTNYEYDLYSGANHASLTPRSSISGLDGSFTSSYLTRGNVTKVSRWIDSITWADTFPQYDVAGNVVKTIDARGKAATFAYDDRFGGPDGEAQSNWAPAELSGSGLSTFAFPTLVTNAANDTSFMQYDYYLGKPVDQEDRNAVVTSFAYNDPLDRPTQQIRSANVLAYKTQTSFSYDPATRTITTTSDLNTFGDNQIRTQLVYDGLGRTMETRQFEDAVTYIATKKTYDALGRALQVSNPYRPSSESLLWTTTAYDALGRVTQVLSPDGAAANTTYLGNQTTITDPAGKTRRSFADSIGLMTQVVEDPNGVGYSTVYCYGTWVSGTCQRGLDNLAGVTQGSQIRTFVYDGLSRLTSATNPESGTVSYQYDGNGNLTQKTDVRGTVTTLIYDDINRLTNRNHAVAGTTTATPNVTYTYGAMSTSCGTYSRGRLCSASSSASTTSLTYGNARGLVTQSTQSTGGQAYNFTYVYDRADNITSETYPSGRIITNAIDSAGRVSAVQRQGGNYYVGDVSNPVQYSAHGAIRQMKLGNGLWNETRFNNRLQPVQIGLGQTATPLTSDLNTSNSNRLLLEFGYGSTNNNGNVLSQNIRIGATTLSQTYTYEDPLNRLTTATESGSCSQTYGYDRFGNRWLSAGANCGNTPALTPQAQTAFDAATNRLALSGYDFVGNLRTDATGRTFEYDAENRQTIFNTGVASLNATYEYDGEGHRVKKLQDGVTTIFVYDANGRLAAEYAMTVSSPGTNYLTSDHLGSTRIVTDANGNVESRHDYLPFGEEWASTYGGRSSITGYSANSNVRQKFTGKERDQETGLDYFGARYMSAAQGRFTSPDPKSAGSDLANPESWNGYAYGLNNPLRYVDQNGKWPTEIHQQIIRSAFSGLSEHQLSVLMSADYWMDHCLTCQLERNSSEHFMRFPSQDPLQAKLDAERFIQTQEFEAQSSIGGRPTAAENIPDKSLSAFGKALHTATDATSPAHVDPQGNPRPWNPYSPSAVKQHNAEEAKPTPEQLKKAITAAQQEFKRTYGDTLYKKAIEKPKLCDREVENCQQ